MTAHEITLFQFPPALGLPNASPFCLKMEAYLRLAGIDYKTEYVSNPAKGPKGKLPYIAIDGRSIADSELIIQHLHKALGKNLDENLTAHERALGDAFGRLVEEYLYWIIVYSRWIDSRYWPQVKESFFAEFPWLLQSILPAILRKQVRRRLYEQGLGRHSREEIYGFAQRTLGSLADFLGDKTFYMGDRPTKIDATMYAFLANIIQVDLDTELKSLAMSHRNLVAYCDRMREQIFQ